MSDIQYQLNKRYYFEIKQEIRGYYIASELYRYNA